MNFGIRIQSDHSSVSQTQHKFTASRHLQGVPFHLFYPGGVRIHQPLAIIHKTLSLNPSMYRIQS